MEMHAPLKRNASGLKGDSVLTTLPF